MHKGKSGSLQFLKELGLRVPTWTTVSHEDIISWGDQSLLHKLQGELREKDLHKIIHTASLFSQTIRIPHEVITKFKDSVQSTFFAVRSSANVEDSKENSFAGIFESKLFVEDIDSSIREVWVSLYSLKALTYALDRKVDFTALKMNIIIQEMIDGEKSGVLFQADPLGNIQREVIVAGFGLGQGIVDDLTETDQYTIQNSGVFKSVNTNKKNHLVLEEGKLQSKLIDPLLAQAEVLTSSEISELIKVSRKLAEVSDYFLDVEFTIRNSTLYILQARPITTVPLRKDTVIFDNSNIAENYPGISTPLTYSILKRGYSENFKNLIKSLGFPKKEREKISRKLEQLVGQWNGQIYYNLNNWYSVYTLLPFGVEKATESFNDMVGIKTTSFLKPPQRNLIEKLRITCGIIYPFISYYLFTKNHHKKYKKEFSFLYQKFRSQINEDRHLFTLISRLEQLDEEYLKIIKIPLFNDFSSSILNKSCRNLAIKMMGQDGEQVYNDLLSHREDLESSKAIYSLISLAESARITNGLLNFLKESLNDSMKMDRLSFQYSHFSKDLKEHFDRFGDRSQWEMKLESPTARENPATTLKLIIDYAIAGMNVEEQKKIERQKSTSAFKILAKYKTKRVFDYLLFKVLFKKCTEAIGFREDSRFDRVRVKGLTRSLLLKIGDHLVLKNQFNSPDDIFYLTLEEVRDLKSNSFSDHYLKELILLRRNHLELAKDTSLMDRIIINDFQPSSSFNTQEIEIDLNQIRGMPCSGGEIEAECVVVKDLNSAPNLSGKILIAERTDPSWGYFFVGVKGIIIEKGSQLSHAAIISRELGIPCIINVTGATHSFQNGMKLRMNGKSGEIQILEK